MAASHTDETRRRLLSESYRRLRPDAHVAFVDESYVVPEVAHGAHTFYIATAYVSPVRLHQPVRDDLGSIVGGSYWHTSEAHAAGDAETIHELCRYLAAAEEDEAFLLAVQSPIEDAPGGDELAREACLTALLGNLHEGQLTPRPSLVVAEERRHQGQRARDLRTIKTMRQAQVIGQMQVTFTSPSVEPLLWVPDIVAFAQSHLERGSDAGYAVPLAPLLRVVPVEKSNPR